MADDKSSSATSSSSFDLKPILSPEARRDLEDALDETPTAEDLEKAWVSENIRDLYRAFAMGRKADPVLHDRTVEEFVAIEGMGDKKDLRVVLGKIYDKYGRLALYDKGVDNLAHHLVAGYKSIRGRRTIQKVLLFVSGTEWTRSCRVLDNLAAMIEAEDPAFLDEDAWAVVEKAGSGIGFTHYRSGV